MATVINGTTGITTARVDSPAGVGGIPVFSSYPVSNIVVATNAWVQVPCASNEYLHGISYNIGNNRFTPQVAGYYKFNLSLQYTCTTGTLAALACKIQKNGLDVRGGRTFHMAASSTDSQLLTEVLLYMNGTTDYVEPLGLIGPGPNGLSFNATLTSFQGYLVRAA